jgi:hypothetical protein
VKRNYFLEVLKLRKINANQDGKTNKYNKKIEMWEELEGLFSKDIFHTKEFYNL